MSIYHRFRRSGITRTKVVCISLALCLLVGLLLPFLQKVSDDGYLGLTIYNMKQIVLGSHAYHTEHNFLPPLDWNAITYGDVKVGPDGKPAKTQDGFHENFYSMIMPYTENQSLYDSLAHKGFTPARIDDGQVSPATVYNLTVDVTEGRSKPIKLYLNSGDPTHTPSGLAGNVAVAGFAINGSVVPMVSGAKGLGFVDLESGIPDGASNTVLVAEKYSGGNGMSLATPWTELFYEEKQAADGGFTQRARGAAFGKGAALEFAPKPAQATWANGVQGSRPTGILMGMADGSVRTLTLKSNKKFPNVWANLIDPKDGAELPPEW